MSDAQKPAKSGTRTYLKKLRIWRGDASGGALQDFEVEVNPGEVVLDIIHRVQATQAGDLAVPLELQGRQVRLVQRRDQRQAAADVPDAGWATSRRTRSSPSRRCAPSRSSATWSPTCPSTTRRPAQIPHFTPQPREEDGTYRMQQIDVERSQEFRKCIECFLCQDVCHVIRDHEDNKEAFAGPRFLMRIAELDMHPLDTVDRKEFAQQEAGLGMCNITKCCTEVCPEGIHITDNALIPMKERVVDRKYDPVTWLGNTIKRRLPK